MIWSTELGFFSVGEKIVRYCFSALGSVRILCAFTCGGEAPQSPILNGPDPIGVAITGCAIQIRTPCTVSAPYLQMACSHAATRLLHSLPFYGVAMLRARISIGHSSDSTTWSGVQRRDFADASMSAGTIHVRHFHPLALAWTCWHAKY